MNFPNNVNKFISHKRERMMNECSINTETNNEDDDLPIIVIKPRTRYPESIQKNFKCLNGN